MPWAGVQGDCDPASLIVPGTLIALTNTVGSFRLLSGAGHSDTFMGNTDCGGEGSMKLDKSISFKISSARVILSLIHHAIFSLTKQG